MKCNKKAVDLSHKLEKDLVTTIPSKYSCGKLMQMISRQIKGLETIHLTDIILSAVMFLVTSFAS